MYLPILIFFCCTCCTTTKAQSAVNFVLEKHYNCEHLPKPTVQIDVVPKTFEARKQILDIALITPIPLGNEIRMGGSVDIEITLNRKSRWQHLFSLEDDFCRVMQLYVGETFYQMEERWGILRGTCPIPKGHYHAVNYTIDYSRMKMQSFPFGKLRSTMQLVEKRSRNLLHCSVSIISNKNLD